MYISLTLNVMMSGVLWVVRIVLRWEVVRVWRETADATHWAHTAHGSDSAHGSNSAHRSNTAHRTHGTYSSHTVAWIVTSTVRR